MTDILKGGNIPNRAGRPKGSRNRTTTIAKDVILGAADKLGGMKRLVSWAQEDPLNERAFWASIYPRVLPLQVTGDPDAPLAVTVVKRVIVDRTDD